LHVLSFQSRIYPKLVYGLIVEQKNMLTLRLWSVDL